MGTIRSAEVIAVGTELLLGEVTDTNSAWLSSQLAGAGVDVFWSMRVGDNMERVQEAIRLALSRSDLVILTGGLGPTDDDMTREAIAAVAGETPEVDPALEAELRGRFQRLGRPMPERNLKQAWLIPSAIPLRNAHGTAPGWLVNTTCDGEDRQVAALPGPPRELKPIWSTELLPRLRLPGHNFYIRTFKTVGIGESDVADRLADLTEQANPSVATYAKRDGVHVRVAAKAGTAAEAERAAGPTVGAVEAALKGHVWGSDEDELPELIMGGLAGRGQTLATAEGFGGGLLMDALTETPHAKSAYCGGVLAWSAQAMGILGVLGPTSDSESGAQLAARMAEAARETFSADFGLATYLQEGQAGRSTGVYSDAEVFVALSAGGPPAVKRTVLPAADSSWRKERILIAALHFLWSQLR